MRATFIICLTLFLSLVAAPMWPAPSPLVVQARIATGVDDAEESETGSMYLDSSDLELVRDGSDQTIGLRFRGLAVPQGAVITRAWLQFQADRATTEATSLSVRAEASDDARAYASTRYDISSRPRTAGAVSWSPPGWPDAGEAGADQRSPDLTSIVQEVVSRPGWASGHALGFIITGEGLRAAESYEGRAAAAPLLVVEYAAPDPVNQPPGVSAGPDDTVILPGLARLDATVTDDGFPDPPGAVTSRWTQVGGLLSVVIGTPMSSRTTVSFNAPGVYVLRLTADDGELASSDEVVLTAVAGTTTSSVEAQVTSGSDDAEESVSSGEVSTGSSDIELVYDGGDQVAGLRFPGLAVPAGATIREAWVQFQAAESSSTATTLAIQAEAADRAASFSSSDSGISSRARTRSTVTWSPEPWSRSGEAGLAQRTPDLSAVVQEVVSRPGWTAGNALALIITGEGERVAESREGSSTGAARLHVEYVGGGGTTPPPPDDPSGSADEVHWTVLGQDAVAFDWRGTADTIRYGTSPGVLGSVVAGLTPSPLPDSSAGPFWEARLTGLREDTLYHYAIGDGPESTFRTPPPRGAGGFWIALTADVGSTAKYPAVGPQAAQIASDNASIPGDDRPRFVMMAGDLAYGDQKGAAEVDNHFNDMMVWSRWAAYMPAWGNHDDGSSTDDRQNYEGRFDFPNSQDVPNPPPAGGPGEEWMWFDYGNARIITYPEPFSGAWSDWQSKADVIMAQAQADPAIAFIITYGHRPPYSSGSDHGGSSIAGNIAALKAKHGKYVLNMAGHSHHYERSDPARTDGVLNIVSGGGGSTLGGLASTKPSWSVFRMNHFSFVKIHVGNDRIDGYAVCGPAGGGATDTCAQDAVVDTWSIVSGAR
jgi:hypothetical protein